MEYGSLEHSMLRNLWLWKCGLPEHEFEWANRRIPSLESLLETETFPEVDKLTNNRLILAAFRYGLMAEKSKENKYDIIEKLEGKLNNYRRTGNKEYLLDLINYAKIEFRYPSKAGAYFNAEDDTDHANFKL